MYMEPGAQGSGDLSKISQFGPDVGFTLTPAISILVLTMTGILE